MMKSLLQILLSALLSFSGLLKFSQPQPEPSGVDSDGNPAMVVTEKYDAEPAAAPQPPPELQESRQAAKEAAASAKAAQERVDELVRQRQADAKQLEEAAKQLDSAKKAASEADGKFRAADKLAAANASRASDADKQSNENARRAKEILEQFEDFKKRPPAPGLVMGKRIPWGESVTDAEQQARKSGRTVFIDMEARHCEKCERVKSQVYETQLVSPVLLREFEPVWHYVPDIHNDRIAQEFGITVYPKAVLLRDGVSEVFEPSDDPKEFLDQLSEHMRRLDDKLRKR